MAIIRVSGAKLYALMRLLMTTSTFGLRRDDRVLLIGVTYTVCIPQGKHKLVKKTEVMSVELLHL